MPEGFEKSAQKWLFLNKPIPVWWVRKAQEHLEFEAEGCIPYAWFDGKLFVRRGWCIRQPIRETQMRLLNALLDETCPLPREPVAQMTSAAWFSAVVATGITQKDKAIAACVDFEQAKQIISSMWVVDPNPPNMQGEGACCQCKEFTGNATGCPHITLYLHLTNVIDVNAMLKKIPKKGPGRPARPQHCLAGPEKSQQNPNLRILKLLQLFLFENVLCSQTTELALSLSVYHVNQALSCGRFTSPAWNLPIRMYCPKSATTAQSASRVNLCT